MAITREQLREQLRRREIARVYTLFGVETYLRDLAARTIADLAFGKDDFRDFNDDAFTLNTPDNIRAALSAADQLPMMAARRVVKVTNVRIGASAAKDTLKEEHFEALSAYLADPSPSSVLIFIADEVNGTRKVGKLLREKTLAVDFTPLDDGELVERAREELDKAGARMDQRDLRHLVALVGPDVRRLTVEIGKLTTAALPETTIGAELIDALVANTREQSNFGLVNDLISGNQNRALRIMSKILDDGAEPIALIGLLSYSFRRLLIVKDMMERGVDRGEVARSLKMRYNEQEPFLAAARRTDITRLKHAIIRLADTDLAIKTSVGGSGPKGSRLQLEMLVLELASA